MNLKRWGFADALGTVAYIAIVVITIDNIQKFFGDEPGILVPMSMLLLFVLSAAITGSLILGRPILMYLTGQKAEAIKLFMYTVGWLAIFTIIFLVLNTIK
jgi:hypothetical protein